MKKLEGKTAIVTGGSRGIGRAICLRLACEGASIVTCCRNPGKEAEKLVADCQQMGVAACCVKADVSQPAEADRLVQEALKITGTLEILVNNAGITADNLLIRMRDEEFSRVLDTNLKGTFYMTRSAARQMMRKRYGRIVNISSIVGIRGNAGQVNYAAAKAGIIGLTRSTARELGSRNITCNAVAPGYVDTDMTKDLPLELRENIRKSIPLGRAGTPEDIAAAVAFLVSDDASYVTGQVLEVTGGM